MSNHRVLKYEATVFYGSTGSSHTALYTFTQVQADSVGGVMQPDGLDIVLARKLCEKWTREGKLGGDIKYTYCIPFCPTRD